MSSFKVKIGEATSDGTRIFGPLAYAGFSKNRRVYFPEELEKGHNKDLPILLNHADFIGIENIPDTLLPPEYRFRLLNKENIVLGHGHLTWDPTELILFHEGIITDPFYRQKHILQQLFVSQGVLFDPTANPTCSPSGATCFQTAKDSEYQEYSLVFNPGFSLAKVFTESNTSLSESATPPTQMSQEKINENNPKGLANELDTPQDADARSDSLMADAGNCPEGMIDPETGKCPDVATQDVTPIVPGLVESSDDKDDDKKDDKKVQGTSSDGDKKDDAKEFDEALDTIKSYKEKLDELYPATSEGYTGPNADIKSHERAQEAYNKGLERDLALKENHKSVISAFEKLMIQQKSKAVEQARVAQSRQSTKVSAIEAADSGVASWMTALAMGNENAPARKVYKLGTEYVNAYVTKKFKEFDQYGNVKMVPHMEKMKQIYGEATNVAMAGGADPENFLRTASELVLIYPDGDIVTPIEQFCEVKPLAPGQKEVLFYDLNKPTFTATDESTVNAGGSGFALEPNDLTINASGGKTTPEGALVRVGYTDNEEIPIDIPKMVNMGFAFAAEVAKNNEVLNTAYNVDTAYNPAADAKRPKGGGQKHVADSSGNTHWIKHDGTQITTATGDDAGGAIGALTFNGLLEIKRIITDTGLDASNIKLYTTPKSIIDVIKDTQVLNLATRSKPEIMTEGEVERLAGVDLIASSALADGIDTGVKRAVAFIPTVSFGFVKGRELQMKAEDVARDQSVYFSGSQKVGGFVKRVESTVRVSVK